MVYRRFLVRGWIGLDYDKMIRLLFVIFLCFFSASSFASLLPFDNVPYPGKLIAKGPNLLPFDVSRGVYVGGEEVYSQASSNLNALKNQCDSLCQRGAVIQGKYTATIDGKTLPVKAYRSVPIGKLAKIAPKLLRALPVIGTALTIADIFYNDQKKVWEIEVPSETVINPGFAFKATRIAGAVERSSYDAALNDIVLAMPGYSVDHVDCVAGCPVGSSSGGGYLVYLRFPGVTSLVDKGIDFYFKDCPPDTVRDGTSYKCIAKTTTRKEATDEDLSAAVLKQGEVSGFGIDLTRRLLDNGYRQDVESAASPMVTEGPTDLKGDTQTKTTTGPEGTTLTKIENNYKISYSGDTITITENKVETTTAPDGKTTTTQTVNTPSDSAKPVEEKPPEKPFDWCEAHPDASGCASLGDDQDQDLGDEKRPLGFSFNSVAGSCPAPYMVSVRGMQKEFSFQPFCDFASGIRPFVIAISMLAAGLFLLGVAGGKTT